jgi:hypothetical protein
VAATVEETRVELIELREELDPIRELEAHAEPAVVQGHDDHDPARRLHRMGVPVGSDPEQAEIAHLDLRIAGGTEFDSRPPIDRSVQSPGSTNPTRAQTRTDSILRAGRTR